MEGQTGNLNQAKQDSAVVSPFMSDQSAVALTTTTDLELDDLSSKQMRRPDPGFDHKHSDYHQLPPVLNSASDDILTDSSCQSEDDEDTNGSASPFVKKLPLIGVAPNNIIV